MVRVFCNDGFGVSHGIERVETCFRRWPVEVGEATGTELGTGLNRTAGVGGNHEVEVIEAVHELPGVDDGVRGGRVLYLLLIW